MIYLVTVKLARDPAHNARKKVTGPCPVTGLECTDRTGQHHTIPVSAADTADAEDYVRQTWPSVAITRIELTGLTS